MDPITLSIIVSAATFAAHLLAARITSKTPPTPTNPSLPTTFGHGELLQFIRQEVSNAIARAGGVNLPPPSPVAPVVPVTVGNGELLKYLEQLVANAVAKAVAATK